MTWEYFCVPYSKPKNFLYALWLFDKWKSHEKANRMPRYKRSKQA